MTHPKTATLVDRITEDLMTNGAGQEASRLVLEMETPQGARDLGGRGPGSVRDTIEAHMGKVVVLPYNYDELDDKKKARLEDYIRGLL